MSSETNRYKSGTVQVVQPDGRGKDRPILDQRFESRKELRKLIIRLQRTGAIVTIQFDPHPNDYKKIVKRVMELSFEETLQND